MKVGTPLTGGNTMRDPKRIKRILKKIEKLWLKNPDQRFYQLLSNYTRLGNREKLGTVVDPWRYEDDETEAILDGALKCFKD